MPDSNTLRARSDPLERESLEDLLGRGELAE
jgi:hypothetical protein